MNPTHAEPVSSTFLQRSVRSPSSLPCATTDPSQSIGTVSSDCAASASVDWSDSAVDAPSAANPSLSAAGPPAARSMALLMAGRIAALTFALRHEGRLVHLHVHDEVFAVVVLTQHAPDTSVAALAATHLAH